MGASTRLRVGGTDRGRGATSGDDEVIRRRIALAFISMTGVSLALSAGLVLLLLRIGALVRQMSRDEVAIRSSLNLATSIREQAIHILHTFEAGSGDHLDHYEAWRAAVGAGAEALRSHLSREDQGHLDAVLLTARQMDELLKDYRETQGAGRRRVEELDRLTTSAAELADALARRVETRMAQAHEEATRLATIGFLIGGTGSCLLCLLAVVWTVQLRRGVIHPLTRLREAAERLGRGDRGVRLGTIGEGELQTLAETFDRMAEEIAARERALVEGERMAVIGRFAAGVAHELNNPIAVIRGYLKTMSPEADPATLEEELQILDDEAAACQRIVDDLLTYARRPDLHLEDLPIAPVLDASVHRARLLPAVQSHRLEGRYDDATVVLDPGRLDQLIANLVRNAAQASPPEAPIDVIGRAVAEEGFYEILVLDRGPGIPEEDLDHIFEPFFSRRPVGHGLGLSVSRNLARAMGGDLDARNRPEGGAAFRIRLPLAGDSAPRGGSHG